MKRFTINKYYDLLMWLEDVFAKVLTLVNNHRKKVDDKYWEKYIK